MRSLSGENKRLLREVNRAGWKTRHATNGVVVYPPDGSRPISLHASDRGGRRHTANAVVQLRRAGLNV